MLSCTFCLEHCQMDIIGNLADNSDGDTISIVLGATNMEKLTDDEIAIATEKNYNIA